MLTDEMRNRLIVTAQAARQWAYAPYSGYRVGAALLTASGRVYDGVNVENAAFPDAMCAERVAIFKAISQGEREFEAIAVATSNGGTPCGSCRQVLAEFGLDTQVLMVDEENRVTLEARVRDLLPGAFTPRDLPPKA
jgi:cytidine deaminase